MPTKLNIFLPVPPVKTLSLGGGGARGAVYGEVLQHLEKTQILSSVEDVYGVSAGAITTNLLAYGATAEEITQLTYKTNFKSLLEEWSLFKGGRGIFYTNQLKDMVKEQGKSLFLKRIEEGRVACEQAILEEPTPAVKARYKELLSQLDTLESKIDEINFGDLERLKKIFIKLGQPNKIKSLSVLAVSTPEGKPYLFSAQTYPDIVIADAVVASCAIPPVFKPHVVKLDGQDQKFIDGGLHRSLLSPAQQVNFKSDMEKRLDTMELLLLPSNLSKTKQFLFDIFSGEGSSNVHIYGKPKSLGFIFVLIGYLAKFLFGADGPRGRYEMQKSVKDYGHNVVSMDVDISPNDFGITLDQKEAAGKQALRSVEEYLQERRQPEHAYMVQGHPAQCLYQVPFEQFDLAIQDIKRAFKEKIAQLQDEKVEEKEAINKEIALLETLIPQIKQHRERQIHIHSTINARISEVLDHIKDNKELVREALTHLEELIVDYLHHPIEDSDISKISEERLCNGIQHQLNALHSALKENNITLQKQDVALNRFFDQVDTQSASLALSR